MGKTTLPLNKELRPHIIEQVKTDNALQAKIADRVGVLNGTVYRWALNNNHKLLTRKTVLEVISEHRSEKIQLLTAIK